MLEHTEARSASILDLEISRNDRETTTFPPLVHIEALRIYMTLVRSPYLNVICITIGAGYARWIWGEFEVR